MSLFLGEIVISFEEASSRWLVSTDKEDVEDINFRVRTIFL